MAIPRKPQSPDPAKFIDPFDHPVLTDYLRNVLGWHGYIRFVGLPGLRENPDVPIGRLYVEPLVGEHPISPDTSPDKWPATQEIFDSLCRHQRLVVLGDPGSGKSTLVSWIACQFARTGTTPCVEKLNRLVPLPMILRDLSLRSRITWNRLFKAFLNREMAKPLRGNKIVHGLLETGQVIVMLDGLDELASVDVRKALREAVFEGMDKYPACRWLLTSRMVGYYKVPFDEVETYVDIPADLRLPLAFHDPSIERLEHLFGYRSVNVASKSYIAPFNDPQTTQFAKNWFALREAAPERADRNAADFVRAVRAHPTTLRLSRTPNLLTMMALIYRVRAKLPHGRALLYNQIAEAYLQSIDEFRSLGEMEYPLAEKRRWLASVAFNMQMRRFEQAKKGKDDRPDRADSVNGASDILVNESDVRSWIGDAMGESGYGRDEKAAADFVDYIARRSGLLLPRGAAEFAFMHLSLQEYFAACFLEEQVTSPLWIKSGRGAPGAGQDSVIAYAKHVVWAETMVFLFELLAHRPGLPQFMAETLFGKDFENIDEYGRSDEAGVSLVAALAVDPHSGFTKDMRLKAIDACCAWEVNAQQAIVEEWKEGEQTAHEPRVLQTLLDAQEADHQSVWKNLVAAANRVKLEYLSLRGTSPADPTPLADLSSVKGLNLSDTPVNNLGFLHGLTNLQRLDLNGTPVSDISGLSSLSNLRVLGLSGCPVSALDPIAELTNLDTLDLSGTRMSDLSPLAGLTNLCRIILSDTEISDLKPLVGLPNLEEIFLMGTKISDAQVSSMQKEREMSDRTEIKVRR